MRVSRGSTEIRRNQGTRLNLIGVEEMLRRESGHDGVRLFHQGLEAVRAALEATVAGFDPLRANLSRIRRGRPAGPAGSTDGTRCLDCQRE
jgi:hypothetical protein